MKTLSKSKGVKEKEYSKIKERLMQKFLKENPMVLADDIPDRFADWIGEKQANLESK